MRKGERALRLSQAATELGTSRYVLLRLCQLAMVEAERTPGGHWRIPCAEVDRLKAEGLPAVPAVIAESEEDADSSGRRPASKVHEGLYRDPSDDLADSAESVLIAENAVRRRKLQLERLKVEDEFAERAQQQANKEDEAWRQAAAAETQREHDLFVRAKLERASDLLANIRVLEAKMQNGIFPLGWPIELDLAVQDELMKVLQKVRPGSTPDRTINDLVKLAVTKVIESFRLRQMEEVKAQRAADSRKLLETLEAVVNISKLLRQ